MVNRDQILANAYLRANQLGRRNIYEDSLYEFLKGAWKYIDPAKFSESWHLQAIAEHLEAVTRGEIKRLCINIPPRCSKSTLTSVAWPAWTWAQRPETGPLAGPQVQFLCSSYAQTLSMRDSVKMRRLIDSPWYQEQWGDRYYMTSDQNTKIKFENSAYGYRLSTSVDGTTTGEGGNIIIIDDAHNAKEVESDTTREGVLAWWDEVMSSRLNDPDKDAFVVIMQRLHEQDLTGHIMDKEEADWTWLMLPMEYEPERHCRSMVNGHVFWEDPRQEDGELLCPARFSKEAVVRLSRSMGPFAAAGQLQQSPSPRGGGIIKDEWWQKWCDPINPEKRPSYPPIEFVLASLDTAYTEDEENDPSALTIWGVFRDEAKNPKMILMYAWQERLEIDDLVELVIDSCTLSRKADPATPHRFPVDRLLIESKASGLSVYQEIKNRIAFTGQFGVELFDPKKYGDKTARLYSIQHLFSNEMIYVPWFDPMGYAWAQDVIRQIARFPKDSHDDFVDSTSMALRYLRDMGFALFAEEKAVDDEELLRYRPQESPLYPVYGGSNG